MGTAQWYMMNVSEIMEQCMKENNKVQHKETKNGEENRVKKRTVYAL